MEGLIKLNVVLITKILDPPNYIRACTMLYYFFKDFTKCIYIKVYFNWGSHFYQMIYGSNHNLC